MLTLHRYSPGPCFAILCFVHRLEVVISVVGSVAAARRAQEEMAVRRRAAQRIAMAIPDCQARCSMSHGDRGQLLVSTLKCI